MIKVTKFGGSSVASANQFRKVKKIIESDPDRKFIVVSALGKEKKDDNKVTDLLYLIKAHIDYNVDFHPLFERIKNKYLEVYNELGLDFDIEKDFEIILSKLNKNTSLDYIVSRGEYLAAKMLANYLGYPFFDAKECLAYNYGGELNDELTKNNISNFLKAYDRFVMPGFYGSYPNGEIHLLSRGGSDISASIIADILNASLYENYTDVNGILVADPKIVDSPKQIAEISYKELRELSYMGAKVLHEDAIFPVKAKNIPIKILNTNEPDNPGTIIKDHLDNKTNLIVKGIAGRQDFSVISIYKNHMSEEVGTVYHALSVLKRFNISVEHVPSGIDSFALVVDNKYIKDNIYEILSLVKKECGAEEVKILSDITLIAVVGEEMCNNPGTSGKIFYTLGKEGINIRLISQSTDEINIIIGVNNEDYERTIKALYQGLIVEQ